MTSNYIIVPIKLCLDVGNDKYIILCTFGSRIMSGFEGKHGGPPKQPPRPQAFKWQEKQKMLGLNRVRYIFLANKDYCCYLIFLIFSLILLVKILQKPHCL